MCKQKARQYGFCLLSSKGQVLRGRAPLNVWLAGKGIWEMNMSRDFYSQSQRKSPRT